MLEEASLLCLVFQVASFLRKKFSLLTPLKGGDGRRYRDVGNGGANLVKTLHGGAHGFTRLFSVEVRLHHARVSALKIRHELLAELFPRLNGGLRHVHEL